MTYRLQPRRNKLEILADAAQPPFVNLHFGLCLRVHDESNKAQEEVPSLSPRVVVPNRVQSPRRTSMQEATRTQPSEGCASVSRGHPDRCRPQIHSTLPWRVGGRNYHWVRWSAASCLGARAAQVQPLKPTPTSLSSGHLQAPNRLVHLQASSMGPIPMDQPTRRPKRTEERVGGNSRSAWVFQLHGRSQRRVGHVNLGAVLGQLLGSVSFWCLLHMLNVVSQGDVSASARARATPPCVESALCLVRDCEHRSDRQDCLQRQ